MNQILITERLYVTPELKKKKKFYRIEFFISVFLVCILFSYYIYAEYDKAKGEDYAQEILANTAIEKIEQEDKTIKDELLVVVLNDEDIEEEEEPENNAIAYEEKVTKAGTKYTEVASINIPKINLQYSVLAVLEPASSYGSDPIKAEEKALEELLKISPCRFHGPDLDQGIFDANKAGNFCIVGHNYRNARFFSKVPTLVNGDIIELTDATGVTLKYVVYDKYIVEPNDVTCTSQQTKGKKEVTLITCTDDSKQRYVIKATEVL